MTSLKELLATSPPEVHCASPRMFSGSSVLIILVGGFSLRASHDDLFRSSQESVVVHFVQYSDLFFLVRYECCFSWSCFDFVVSSIGSHSESFPLCLFQPPASGSVQPLSSGVLVSAVHRDSGVVATLP